MVNQEYVPTQERGNEGNPCQREKCSMNVKEVTKEVYMRISKVKHVSGCFTLILSFCFLLAACSTMGVNETVRYENDIEYCKNKLAGRASPGTKRGLKNTIGLRYLYLGEPDVAIRWLEEALVIKDESILKDEAVINNLAVAYSYAKKYNSAKENYSKLLNTSYRQCGIEGLGHTCFKLKEYEKALNYYNKLSLEKPDFVPYNAMSSCYEKMGDIDSALKEQKKAVESASNCLPEQVNLLRLKILAGEQVEKSYEQLMKLYRTNPGHAYILYALSAYSFENGDYDKAKEWLKLLKKSLKSNPCYRCKRSGNIFSTYAFDPDDANELLAKIEALPCAIGVNIAFSDISSLLPNNTIDAGEQSTITATITNKGKGTAFDVNIITESEYKNINFPETISIGDIQPGESKDITIPIKGNLSLTSGTASFLINAREKRGYAARPVELQIPAAKLRSPELLFASCSINDFSGLADGDGDGVPENNEIIELNPYVSNKGKGDALKISVKLTNITKGIEIIKGNDDLPSIGAGAVGKSTLAFKIPRTFAQPEIKYTIAATDVRGMRTEKTYTVPFQSKAPVLFYTYQVVNTQNREMPGLENGRSYKIRITPKNSGNNVAEGVKIRVNTKSGKVIIGNYNGNIGVLQPDSLGSVITVPLSLSRSFLDSSISINVAMTQESFSGMSRKITLPVMVKKPVLKYQVALLNGVSDKKLSQNSWPKFRVSVSNNGNLDAKDVTVKFYVLNDKISFNKGETIGTIKVGESQYKDFTFFVRGDAPVGEMPVKVNITQSDFDDIRATLAYQLTKQTAIVKKVKAAGGGAAAYAGATYSGPPELYINSPNKDVKTYKKTIDLHGSIMTFGTGNAVQSLSISLNGKPLKIISVTEDIRFDANQITKRPAEDNKTIFDGVIFLEPGINVVEIRCVDRNGRIKEQSVRIVKKAKLGNIYAVVMGISKFHNQGYNLNYAASDGRKFYDFLRSEAGGKLPKKRVKLLTDSSATRANVIGTLTSLLGKATKEDTVEIYIATHGITDFDGTLYYLCYDTNIENLRGTGFSDRDLTDILNKNIAAGKIIIYLDVCHSGLSGLSERYAKRSIGVYEVNERINSLAGALSKTAATGVVCFSASSSTGYSLEDSKWNGGIFTHCLVNGLEGKANENKDEWVTVDELDSYLVKKVLALTEGKQRPKVNGTLMGDTPLSRVR